MKAVVLRELNGPLAIETQIELPKLGRGQVLVQVAYSGICFSQVMEARGGRGPDRYLPHLLGHEASGIVASVGPEVTKVKAGDRVVLGWIRGSGLDGGGATYQCRNERINAGPIATFCEQAVVSENRLTPLPSDIPMDVAVLFGCAIPTGAGIVMNTMKPESGSTVAVFGLGGIGLSALMATQLYSCREVVAVDVEPEKLQLAQECGATRVIDARSVDPVLALLELTQGRGVDFSVEAAGTIKTIEQSFMSVRKNGGLCVFASHPPTGQKISLDPHDLISGKRIEGTWGGACHPDRDLPLFFDLYRQGKLPLKKFFKKRYRLEDINQALDDMENRRTLRPLLEINPSLV